MKPRLFGIRLLLVALLALPTIGLAGAGAPASPPVRKVLDFDADWRFSKGDFATAIVPAFDDAAWRAVSLPHDWSSEGPFGPEYASGNGYAPGGVAWLRQSLWTDKPMVHLFAAARGGGAGRGQGGGFGRFSAEESWNWPSNALVTVRCCTTCPEVVLFLNDRPIGTNHPSQAVQGLLSWQVPFEPGVLKAVGLDHGQAECEFALPTAGPAQRIELLPDGNELRAEARDIRHLEFRIVDAQGVRVPDATAELAFTVDGPARLLGIENGGFKGHAKS